MEILYEESALNQKSKKQAKFYAIANVVFWISFVITVFSALWMILLIPAWIEFFGQLILVVLVGSLAFVSWFIKQRINVSYDYTFVSGELRIARIFNVNKRKFLYEIFSEEILQIGDVEGPNYERLASDPQTKVIDCTPNAMPAEEKFFMYILVKAGAQKQLYILECRELMLMHILRFTKRGALEEGYVSQETKQAERAKEAERQRLAKEEAKASMETKADVFDEQELAAMRAAEAVSTPQVTDGESATEQQEEK